VPEGCAAHLHPFFTTKRTGWGSPLNKAVTGTGLLEVDARRRRPPRGSPAASAVSGPRRILVVEDNASLRRGIARALRERWSEVDELADGERARERLAERGVEPYDVVVTDLRLPGADGVEVLRAARRRDARTAVR
jgi:PleD family two-component response regulator